MARFKLLACLAIVLSCAGLGCNPQSDYKSVDEAKKAPPLPDHDHGHGAKGPHGGGLVELGAEEYHAEILVDHDTESVVVYVLGKDAKTDEFVAAQDVTIALEGKEPLTLKAAPKPDSPEGKTSKFALEDHDLVHALMDAGFLHGDLRITIGDKPYIGHIDYHLDGSSHDEHGHDEHGHDEKKPEETK
ncbi:MULTISPECIES: hypothetical protein [unclassified Schlesneria]|uniref:hypothetical protein n=1 Tax=Schlesneria TaxID=656899 RepID=UPI00359F8E41